MTFTDFEKYMEAVHKDYRWMDLVTDALNSDVLYENLESQYFLLDLMTDIFEDKEDWIGYYVFELNWGKEYEPGKVKDEDGNDIPLATLEDLYNILTKKKEETK